MKNIWKFMAALLVVALPFVATACGDDDKPEGPKTYTYTWLLQNTSLPSSATTAEKADALLAETTVNGLFATAFRAQGFTVDANAQEFTITTEDEISTYDNKVKAAIYNVKGGDALSAAAQKLPTAAKIQVKRGSTTIITESLR
ncbi:MAG: hypothetical protein IJ209_01125 [Bacteroidaceae bacterium]|nr:hypothetical protein [Bacteroidaceae bacterium]